MMRRSVAVLAGFLDEISGLAGTESARGAIVFVVFADVLVAGRVDCWAMRSPSGSLGSVAVVGEDTEGDDEVACAAFSFSAISASSGSMACVGYRSNTRRC